MEKKHQIEAVSHLQGDTNILVLAGKYSIQLHEQEAVSEETVQRLGSLYVNPSQRYRRLDSKNSRIHNQPSIQTNRCGVKGLFLFLLLRRVNEST